MKATAIALNAYEFQLESVAKRLRQLMFSLCGFGKFLYEIITVEFRKKKTSN